ncbi:retrotransposon protein, putative, ty1-copia subclass [Tanacetum coccineum]
MLCLLSMKKAYQRRMLHLKSLRFNVVRSRNRKLLKERKKGKGKFKLAYAPNPKNPSAAKKEHPSMDATSHHCKEVGHLRMNCPVYLSELMKKKKKKQVGFAITSVSKNNVLYFSSIPRDGIYEIDMLNLVPNVNSTYNVSSKRAKHNLDSTYLWHCRLAHISKKRIEKLQHDWLLKTMDDESFDQCVSCLSSKMKSKPFLHKTERALLGLIHIDVCGPLRDVSRQGASCFITFNDDFSRYGYVYLLKHKYEVFETFKVFKNEVENQVRNTIKALRSDQEGVIYRTEVCVGAIYPNKVVSRGLEAEQKQVEIMDDRRDKDKKVNMAARYSDDALVCCVKNTVKDRIMVSSASFHATYCKEELKGSSYAPESWTLKDVRYILSLKRMLISVGQLDEEGYHHQRLSDMSRIGMNMLASKGNIPDVRKVDIYFCKPGGLGKQKNLSFIMSVKTKKVHSRSCDRFCVENGIVILKMVPETPLQFGVAERLSRTLKAKSTGLRVEAPKMLWADLVSTTYLIYCIPYILIGLRIPKEEWRGKDISLAHLKVFGCDSFIKVKYVCGEAMKCTFIGSGSNEVRYSFQDTKSHQVIRSRDITFVNSIYAAKAWVEFRNHSEPGGSSDTSEGSENSGSFEDSGRSDEEDSKDGASSEEEGSKTPQVRRSSRESRAPVRYSPLENYFLENDEPESYLEALSSKESIQSKKAINEEMVSLEKNQTCSLVRLPARKKALQRLWIFKVKEEQNGKKRYKARLVVKGFQQIRGEPSYVGVLNDTSTQHKSEGFQLAGHEENLECRLKEILYGLIQASRLWVLIFVEDSWNEDPCSDVHQVGDEIEVKVLRSFNWPPSELITDDGVYQRERKVRAVSLFKGRWCNSSGRENYVVQIEWDRWSNDSRTGCVMYHWRGGLCNTSLARGVQFSTGRAVWHGAYSLARVVQFNPVDFHDYPSRGYHVISCVDYIPHLLSDYALKSVARILNMVLTKKVDKTSYKLWCGKVHNLSYLKVWGCEALVKLGTLDKLQQRSVKCIFIGYPKEIMGYYSYFPPENKFFVARYVEFLENNLISQEASGRVVELEEIQDEDTSPSENTSEHLVEAESIVHQEDVVPIRRFERTHRSLECLCLNVEVEEHSLGDLNEPTNYKAALSDPESNKWLDAMNAEMQSMKDNQV